MAQNVGGNYKARSRTYIAIIGDWWPYNGANANIGKLDTWLLLGNLVIVLVRVCW